MWRLLAAGALALAACTRPAVPSSSPHGAEGRAATQSFDDARAGRAVLVVFWASWCETCAEEVETLNRLAASLDGARAAIVGVGVGETPETSTRFARATGPRYALVLDPDYAIADRYAQTTVPAFVVLDRRGEVRHASRTLDREALQALRVASEAELPRAAR